MTRPRPPIEPGPEVAATSELRTSGGVATTLVVSITNRAAEPRAFMVSALGVDTTWVPAPAYSAAVQPGETIDAQLVIRPAEGSVPARYPLAVAVQAMDPTTRQGFGTTLCEVDLVLDAPGQITVALDPPDTSAVHTRRIAIELHNSGQQAEQVYLDANSPYSTTIDLRRGPHLVPPGATVRVPGRLTVKRPTLLRRPVRHVYSVTARTSGAPRFAEGSFTARSVIGPTGGKVIAVLAVIVLWVSIALIAIPGLADKFRKPSAQGATSTAPAKPGAKSGGTSGKGSGGGSGTGGGSGGHGTNGSGSSTGGAGGSGGAGGAGGAGHAATKPIQLAGTVTGTSPAGVTVTLTPTTFGAPDTAGATGVGMQSVDDGPIGKLTPAAIEQTALTTRRAPTPDRAVHVTSTDGAWSFGNIVPVGFYVLQFSKPGYQTQRFVIDPTSAAATQPMQVALSPGTGALHGVVRNSAGGIVGGATITITDGANTLTTSTVSKGSGAGSWAVTGLSTPSTYLVSASHDGLGVASRLVTLPASGASAVALTMSSGIATLSGMIRSVDAHGHNAPVGAVTVSATDGTVTRTASTVTTGAQTGRYVLPDLTVGAWTITATAPGYETQTSKVTVKAGTPKSALGFELVPSTVDVAGQVLGRNNLPVVGAGLVLTNAQNTYKQTTIGNGRFGFSNVAPGTYTLSAEYFGYQTAFQAVVATIGHPTAFAKLALSIENVVHSSVISGYVGNAASSSGSLGCIKATDGTVTLGCDVSFALIGGDGSIIPATVGTAHNSPDPFEAVTPDGPTPYLLSLNSKDGDGLEPGLYKLRISSIGYLPATISIEVPYNRTAAAPQVSLFPDNNIAGTVSTIGQINGDGLTTNTPGANCAVAVPIGYPQSAFDVGNFSCDPNNVASGEFGPADIKNLQQNCTSLGTPEPSFGLIDNAGKYTIPNLCNGQYTVTLVIANNSYDPGAVATATETVAGGVTVNYSPSLPRKPVVDLQANLVNPDTGATNPLAANTAVTATCSTRAAQSGNPDLVATPSGQTDANGIVRLWGIWPGQVDNCSVSANGVTSDTGPFQTTDDQIYSATATFTNALPALFGRITSNLPTPAFVANTRVQVRVLTGYTGSAPDYVYGWVTTNANGCFAVNSSGSLSAAAGQVPAECGTSADFADATVTPTSTSGGTFDGNTGNVVKLTPMSKKITAWVDPTVRTAALDAAAATLTLGSVSPVAQLNPAPLSVPLGSASAITTVPANLSINNASVSLTDYSATAPAAGTITASVTSSGTLTWTDSNVGTPGQVAQGTYALTISGAGFQDLHATLDCSVHSGALSCTLSPASIRSYGELSGLVLAPSAAPPHSATTAVNGARVYAVQCLTPADAAHSDPCASLTTTDPSGGCPPTIAADAQTPNYLYAATTDSSGRFDFVGSNGRYMVAGTYDVVICAPGLIDSYVTGVAVHEGDNSINPSGTVTMALLGGVSGRVVGSNDTSTGLSQTSVMLYSCGAASDATTCNSFVSSLTTDGAGGFVFNGDAGRYFLTPGHYQLRFTHTGYVSAHYEFEVQGSDNFNAGLSGPVTLDALGGLSGTVTSGGQTVAGVALTLTKCGTLESSPNCHGTVVQATSSGAGFYQFTGPDGGPFFLDAGTYQLTAGKTGYGTFIGPVTISRGNLTQAVQLTLLGAVSGTIVDLHGNGIAGATVTLRQCQDLTDSTCTPAGSLVKTAITDSSGKYAFNDLGNPNIFTPGYWKFGVRAPGFIVPAAVVVPLQGGDNSAVITTAMQTLTPLDGLSGTVHLDTDSTQPIPNVTLTVSDCSTTPCTDLATTTSNASGQYQFSTPANGTNFLPDGAYRVRAVAAGFATFTDTTPTLVSGDNTFAVAMSRLAALQGTVTDNLTGSPGVFNATVTATQCTEQGASATACTTSGNTSWQTVTDASGSFSITSLGNPYLFAPSSRWQISVTAPGHVAATPFVVTLANGVNTLAAPAHPQMQLTAFGSLTGQVLGATGPASTQTLSGAQVSYALCDSTYVAPATTCTTTGTTKTVSTDPSGNYTITGTNSANVLTPGFWLLTPSATGYVSVAHIVSVASGSNSSSTATATDPNFRLDVKPVTVPITVNILGTGPTKHATLTLTRTDGGANPTIDPVSGTESWSAGSLTVNAKSGSNPPYFEAVGLAPTTYYVSVGSDGSAIGNSLLPTTAVITVPPTSSGSAPGVSVTVTVVRSTITGVVTGQTGATTTAPQQHIVVELLDATGTPVNDNSDTPITAQTGANGTFSIGGVPNGNYELRINHAPATANGYGEYTSPAPFAVGYGQTSTVPTVTLAALTHTATVTLTYAASEQAEVSAAHATLTSLNATSATSSPWSAQSSLSPTAAGTNTVTFSAPVQFGCWKLSLQWGSTTTHPGSLAMTVPASTTCSDSDAFNVPVTATSPAATYRLNEFQLTVNVQVSPNAAHDPSGAPGGLSLTVNGGAAQTVTNGSSVQVFVAPGTTVPVALTPTGSNPGQWTTDSKNPTVSADTSVTVTSTEQLGSISAHYSGATSTSKYTMTITCNSSLPNVPSTCAAGIAGSTQDSGSGSPVVFNNLSPGSWTVTATPVGGGTSETQNVTVVANSTASTQNGPHDWSP